MKNFKIFISWFTVTLGALIAAMGYTLFVTPMHFYEGGVIGIAYLGQYIFNIPLGLTNLVLTFVIFIIGSKFLGKGFGIKSTYTVIVFSILLEIFEFIYDKYFPEVISQNQMLNSFYGGILTGTGMGLLFFHGSSIGGSAAFAQIMRWIKRIPIARTLMITDTMVLSLATIWAYKSNGINGLETIMYTFIFIFIQIKTINTVLNGFNSSQRLIITTTKPDEIKDAIFNRLNRGVTYFSGIGAYTGLEKIVLTTVIPKKNVPSIIRIISQIDDRVFIVVQDVSSVYGVGFEALPKEGEKPVMKSIQEVGLNID